MWNLPEAEIEPVSPALASTLLTTGPPGKPSQHSCQEAGRGLPPSDQGGNTGPGWGGGVVLGGRSWPVLMAALRALALE